ncbi:MAG: alpha/beta fold hydrolase [Pseudomonadota bacterium]
MRPTKRRFVAAAICLAASFALSPALADPPSTPALTTQNVPETSALLRERLRPYQNVRSAVFGGWSADGESLYAITGFGQTPQVYLIGRSGVRRQITSFNDPIRSVTPSPIHPHLLAVTVDRGGDENFQVFMVDRDTGDATLISDGVGRKGPVAWSPDGSTLAWYTTLEGAQRAIVVAPVDDPGARRSVFKGEGWWSPAAWSPDGSTLLISHYKSVHESELFLLNVETAAISKINPALNNVAYGDYAFSHDGRALFYTSDEAGEFLNLFRLDLQSGDKINLTADIEWDVESVDVSRDGRSYGFTVNEDGGSKVYLRSARNDRSKRAPVVRRGMVHSIEISPDGRRLGFTYSNSQAPAAVFAWKLRGRRGIERWVESDIGTLDPGSFVVAETFSYPTFDSDKGQQRRIPASILRPRQSGKRPVVISIHGGPEAQARQTFSAIHQFWASELGIAVVRPNVRGSTGYGKTYAALDNGLKREDAVKDIGALIEWIRQDPDLDETRIILHGISYGGYMVLAAAARYGDDIAGGVSIAGISDFVTFLENTAEYRRDLRRREYGDERDRDIRAFLNRISPLNVAGKIASPMLIVQGRNDPRVPVSEATQLLAAIRDNGGEAWYMLARDEGHGFLRKSNRDALSEAEALFFSEMLQLDLSEDGLSGAP